MAEFYKELKALREEKQIILEDIHAKTKINLEYLKAIEDGQFDILPKPYIRLFLKAYTIQIGGEPEKSLNQLEQMMAARENKPFSTPAPSQRIIKEIQSEENMHPESRSPKKVRSDVTKGILLLTTFLFAIFIIRKINTEVPPPSLKEQGSIKPNQEAFITSEDLMLHFGLDLSHESIIETDPPYMVKISTINPLLFSVTNDHKNTEYQSLSAGDHLFYSFQQKLSLILKSSLGVKITINGQSLSTFEERQNPVRLHFSVESSSKTVKTDYFIPK